jgi:hypothetical protein
MDSAHTNRAALVERRNSAGQPFPADGDRIILTQSERACVSRIRGSEHASSADQGGFPHPAILLSYTTISRHADILLRSFAYFDDSSPTKQRQRTEFAYSSWQGQASWSILFWILAGPMAAWGVLALRLPERVARAGERVKSMRAGLFRIILESE